VPFFVWGEGLAEENYGWIFVDTVPLLYDKKKVARQLQIETWLDLYQLTKELNIQKLESSNGANMAINYVI
jgi:maltose-binding protein MalE